MFGQKLKEYEKYDNKWIIYSISKLLCYVDIFSFWIAYPKGFDKKMARTLANNAISSSLGQTNIDFELLCDMLRKHRAVISGSFLLHCIFGNKMQNYRLQKEELQYDDNEYSEQKIEDISWQPNDIDLLSVFKPNDEFLFELLRNFSHPITGLAAATYSNKRIVNCSTVQPPCALDEESLNELNECLEKQLIGKKVQDLHHGVQTKYTFFNVKELNNGNRREYYRPEFQTIITEQNSKWYEFREKTTNMTSRQYPHTLPISSRTYRFDSINIDVNHIHTCDPSKSVLKYIDKYFDVDFCKIVFDGDRLQVKNWNDILNRHSIINWKKYIEIHTPYYQGPHPPLQDIFWSQGNNAISTARDTWFYSRLCDRIKKYKQRGLKITFDHNDTSFPKHYSTPSGVYGSSEIC